MAKVKTKIKMTHVPYRGAGPLMNDLVAGHVDAGVATLASTRAFSNPARCGPMRCSRSSGRNRQGRPGGN